MWVWGTPDLRRAVFVFRIFPRDLVVFCAQTLISTNASRSEAIPALDAVSFRDIQLLSPPAFVERRMDARSVPRMPGTNAVDVPPPRIRLCRDAGTRPPSR